MTSDRRTPFQLRQALFATEEALVNTQARVARMEPMWAAGHAYCAAYESDGDYRLILHAALLAAHRATTPSPDEPGYVVIAVAELAVLREELEDLRMQCAKDTDELERLEDDRTRGRCVPRRRRSDDSGAGA